MEAAAAVIAVITVSLQSTKLVYQTVEGIRNGPAVVAELASRTRKLEGLLQQLLDLIHHSQHSIQTQDQDVWKPLDHEISQCSGYLKEAADELKGLDSSLPSHRIGKTWRRIKGSLKDKDLELMSERMQSYVAMLDMQLNIINSRLGVSREVYERRQLDTVQDSLRETSAQLSLESMNFKDCISQNAQKVNGDLMQLATAVHDSSNLTQKVVQHTSQLIVERMNNNHAELQQNTEEVAGSITTRLERLENLSTEQFKIINDLSRQIEIQSSLKHEVNYTNPTETRLPEVEQRPEANSFALHGSALSAALDRLCLLASNTGTVCYSEDAEDIIDDLECVLDAILNQEIRATGGNCRDGKRKRCDEGQSRDVNRQIKRVRGILSASQVVELNNDNSTRHRHDTRSERKQMTSKRFAQVYSMNDCTAIVSFRTDTNSVSGREEGFKRLHTEDALSTLRGSISILPNTDPRQFKISVSFLQRLTSSGFSCVNPGLLFHPVVPEDAEIFKAVTAGDVDRMLELFNTGNASLRDCDVAGRSLLHYGIAYQQLSSCRFLVHRGADVDSMERGLYDTKSYCPPLLQRIFSGPESGPLEKRDELAISECLLENGADPGSVIPRRDYNTFHPIVEESRSDMLLLTLKHGREYIDLSERDDRGRNYILQMLAKHFVYRRTAMGKKFCDNVIRKIQILHSYGVEIGSKDNEGRGCLHTLLDRYWYQFGKRDIGKLEVNARTVIGILSYLIGTGADIYAVDKYGWSVTELAHFNRLGRLWEIALGYCGLDIQQVYLDDHHSTLAYSNDIYAPDKDQPRQVRPLDSAYYDFENMDLGVKVVLLYDHIDISGNAQARVFDLAGTESSDYDSKASEWSEESIIEDYDDEESHLSSEQCSQISGEDQTNTSSEDGDSDEEMGGVPVTV